LATRPGIGRFGERKFNKRKGQTMKRGMLVLLSLLTVGASVGLTRQSAQAQRVGSRTQLAPAAKAALLSALAGPDGEYAARATYAAILAVPGWEGAQPFANILLAEQQHVAALLQQCQKYGVPVPADTYFGNVTPPETLLQAAEIGVEAETVNVAMYNELLTVVKSYPSLVQAFTNLRDASLYNHLPAFEAAVNYYTANQ
jgi:hypothetical protein